MGGDEPAPSPAPSPSPSSVNESLRRRFPVDTLNIKGTYEYVRVRTDHSKLLVSMRTSSRSKIPVTWIRQIGYGAVRQDYTVT